MLIVHRGNSASRRVKRQLLYESGSAIVEEGNCLVHPGAVVRCLIEDGAETGREPVITIGTPFRGERCLGRTVRGQEVSGPGAAPRYYPGISSVCRQLRQWHRRWQMLDV
jgi:hypothetical protein